MTEEPQNSDSQNDINDTQTSDLVKRCDMLESQIKHLSSSLKLLSLRLIVTSILLLAAVAISLKLIDSIQSTTKDLYGLNQIQQKQIEQDALAGRFDALAEQANQEFEAGGCKPL